MPTKTWDKYLYFTFKNIHSSIFGDGLFIVNKGDDLKIVASPDSTVNFATPEYQNNTYYLGTTQKQKTFKHNLAADNITWDEVQKLLLWLKVGEKGFLFYDFDCFWGWDVVVTKVGDVTYHKKYDDTFIIETSVEFKTYGDWHARSTIAASYTTEIIDPNAPEYGPHYSSIANDYGIPEIVADGNNYDFLGIGDSHSFVDIMFTVFPMQEQTSNEMQTDIFSIAENNNTILSYIIIKPQIDAFEDNYYYYGKYGFIVDLQNNEIIEKTNKVDKSYQSSKIFEITNSTPIKLNIDTDIMYDNVNYWLNYKYYNQLEEDFYLVLTQLNNKKELIPTYDVLGKIQYGAAYDVIGVSTVSIFRDSETGLPVIKDGKWIRIDIDKNTLWSSIQSSPIASLYACNYHRYQIQAPQLTITVDKHNNNN